jgi:hypothetical protein
VADYDRDGRLDIFLASWWPQIPSKLFLNRSNSNHWLQIRVVGRTINRMGIGVKVRIYPAGSLGEPEELAGYQQIATSYGFCSSHEAVAHFGLGELTECDIEIELPFARGTVHKRNVKADRLVVVDQRSALK